MPDRPKAALWAGALVLALMLAALFHRSFAPGQVLFSNDGPLGVISVEAGDLPGALLGYWHDINWIGEERPPALPTVSQFLGWVLGDEVLFSKFYAPIALLLLGLAGWILFRSLGFGSWACLAGAVAFALNMNAFSNACWGLPSRALTLASAMLALAALHLRPARRPWLRYAVAGALVGHGVMEGFDVGALYSVAVGAYAFLLALGRRPDGRGLARGAAGVAGMALCAAAVSFYALYSLWSSQIQGVVSEPRNELERQAQWNHATQFSLPVRETLRVAVPGLFGYRLSSLEGRMEPSSYWGAVGRDPEWEPGSTARLSRHSGSGEYAGALVLALAAFALAHSLRSGSPLAARRPQIWFWAGVALFSLLMAWGRHFPLYRVFYDTVPWFSAVRNPIKFMHLFQLAALILFGYGIDLLLGHYLDRTRQRTQPLGRHLRDWWSRLGSAPRRGTMACGLFLALGAVGWLIYASSEGAMLGHLAREGIPEDLRRAMFALSAGEALRAVLFFLLSLLLVFMVLAGLVHRSLAVLPGIACPLLLFADLGRANLPWIQHYDYTREYRGNALTGFLEENTREHRFTSDLHPFWPRNILIDLEKQEPRRRALFGHWKQSLFPWFGISTIDIVQMPRLAAWDRAFASRFLPRSQEDLGLYLRLWELTSTRYIFGMAGALDSLRQLHGGEEDAISIALRFDISPRPGSAGQSLHDLHTPVGPEGVFAVFDYKEALPRAVRYHQWESLESGEAALERIASPGFDPSSDLVVTGLGESRRSSVPAGEAVLAEYHPRRIVVRTEGEEPGILLFNDRYHSHWKAEVDGEPAVLLRCNYIMRGVRVPEGGSEVVFRYRPPRLPLWTTLLALGAALAAGLLLWRDFRIRGSGGPSPATGGP